MKSLLFSSLLIIFLAGSSKNELCAASYEAQLGFNQSTNYVVIGAFSIRKNAMKVTAEAASMNAKFEMNPNRNLYYVYVMTTEDHELALREATRLRNETPYYDAWVYNGSFGKETLNASKGVDINPETRESFQPKNQDKNTESTNLVEAKSSEAAPEEVIENTTESQIEPTKKDLDDEIKGKAFFFQLSRADNSAQVSGDVDVIDIDRSRKIGSYEGNREVRVSSPGSRSNKVSLICEVFGYRKQQVDVDYNNPEGENILQTDSSTVVPFQLVRLQKGDIAVMYNVYFFKDAAVMRPESRYEVNSLLEMLNENKNYKIKIHGHTNGNAAGKITSMEKDSENFFALTNTKDGFGSAKKLSEERALVIKNYLVSNGVSASRMHVKAWGGKRPIIDKMHSQAQVNVRVEIEILED